jgi:amino acid transporter
VDFFNNSESNFYRWYVNLICNLNCPILVMALTFANYALQPVFGDCGAPDFVMRVLASSVIVILTAINCYKVRWSTRIQDYSTIAKIGALIVISLVGLVYLLLG